MSNMSLTVSKVMIKRFFWPVNKDIYLGRVYKMVCFTGLYLGPLFLIIHRLLFSKDRQIIFYRQCHCILCLSTLLFSELSDIHLFSCLTLFNHNIIVHSWLVSTVQLYFQHVDFYGFPHFLAFVEVMKEHDAAGHDSSVPIVKQWSQSTHTLGHQTQPTYAVISVNDICHQVGLVQYLLNGNQFYVIAPYSIFNNNMCITKGNLSIL
ncbi:hypothetical protein PHYBLDRAFT_62165 [Phycomyces blakesleeanus NRRL 1555(-)]|uniref:Uncharacterized protein n=1 Tax=Phycomyces blakesleeanus (strain ATCC 8743b / DSM 1359 / FGSC 10004 / NBRC 33097 / NRRL 1555) TaxID=763407 RepID=A0A162UZW2_PHYB8|nr:hypothetical protein PHYBLDRAFT_62165 [Phycomyces blakesleeanus NRRL 1555(-)]OAD79072.1 hypothetical protein PHYBLDRAFT_62165 [Phycomyces blakesleeanus NRRL 1555(-)]|eukprot:XP_018297112.1 hypothetical protein PHYBLDRAFT_62165 [Phycomyces blakesleeanus NRRL 1555(-)]